MAKPKPLHDTLLKGITDEFISFGGRIEFRFFKLTSTSSVYNKHLIIAKCTIVDIIKSHANLKLSFIPEKLENSGQQISAREFMGPHFDLIEEKPLIRGKEEPFLNNYFYYDATESAENIVDFKQITQTFPESALNGVSRSFAGAFLEPPHGLGLGKSIFEDGELFINFSRKVFSDLSKLEIYKWSIECSSYFDEGKEWWGAHFWTIYNPINEIYIGLVASTTD